VCGRLDAVAAELPAAMDLALGISGDLAMYSTGGVMIAAFISQLFAGGLAEIDLVVGALHAQAVERVDDPFRGVWSFVLGRSALAQGRVAEALLRLRDSTALLRDLDPGGMLPWSLASLAYALGVAGDANAATATMTEVDAARRKDMHNIDIDIELARAWAANARGERTQARAFAEKIGRALLDDGRTILGAYGLHDAMRLGVDASSLVDDLSAAAAVCDGVVADTFAAHARALVAKDLDALLAASSTFEGAGWVLQAAECAAAAGMVASEMGLKRRERDASAIAASLARRCAPAVTPMLETIAADASVRSLTKREHEVALMAARGMSKREIANALFLSVRTVGNHINHIYGKLGVRSRAELHEFFAPDR
jgi:DNA-binding CsgD family transcriptional regulator